jgi:hypothetical protein
LILDNEKKQSSNKEDSTARAEKEINEFFYEDEKDNNLNDLINDGLSSIYIRKPEDQK